MTKKSPGFILPIILVFSAFIIVASVAWISFNVSNFFTARNQNASTSTLSVAEAGINYYLWHLSHDPTDYQDGTGAAGPYIHDYKDASGNTIGQFTLTITPPPLGSSVATVESQGKLNGTNQTRKITAQLGIPSFARYAIIANDAIRFGYGTETYGPVHSNGGMRFDGIAYDVVTSAATSYDDADHSGAVEFGVHTHRDPPPPDPNPTINSSFRPLEAPPNTVPTRTDVFKAGRQFPVPNVDFNAVTTDLSNLRTKAQTSGFYVGPSNAIGYRILLKTDDTFDLYKVTAATAQCTGRVESGDPLGNVDTDGITTEQVVSTNNPFPANGIIFVEDKLWVEGQINTAQLTIAGAKIGATPSEEKSIAINKDIEYTNYDGTDKLGLIAQKHISIGLYSEGDTSGTADQQELRVDAALLAQKGRVGRNYFVSSCGATYTRNKITVNGSIGTAKRYGFTWGTGCPPGSGYCTRILTYDANFTIVPPPSFPTTGSYTILSWKEK